MSRDDTRLILRDVPVFLWIFGLIFAGIGVLMLVESRREPAMALALVALGLGFLLFTSLLTITADRTTRTLTLDYRSILRHVVKQLSFDEIAAFNVERSSGSKGSTFRVSVVRKDGKVIPFHSYSSTGSGRKERQAGMLRDFIGVAQPQPQVDEIHETEGVRWQVRPIGTSGPTGARWHSADFTTPGVFLFIAQKAQGQASGGFLASLGSMFFKQAISMYGFQAHDTPGIDKAGGLAPLDPALEQHFMAFTNDPASARQLLNPNVTAPLAEWAGRYPLKQFQMGSGAGQLVAMFSPTGVYLANLNLSQPGQKDELAALGTKLVKSQGSGRLSSSASL